MQFLENQTPWSLWSFRRPVLGQLAQTSKDPTEGWEVGFRNGFLEG